jgi:putative oxygen-independent coproporphyrinogen III oxidase
MLIRYQWLERSNATFQRLKSLNKVQIWQTNSAQQIIASPSPNAFISDMYIGRRVLMRIANLCERVVPLHAQSPLRCTRQWPSKQTVLPRFSHNKLLYKSHDPSTYVLRRSVCYSGRGIFTAHAASASSGNLTREQQLQDEAENDGIIISDPEPFSAYIHLPFCKKKCFYCDFPVIAVGMRPDDLKIQDTMTDYIDAICREIVATKRINDSGPLKTVFFGGGTPALTSPALLEQILKKLDKNFGIAGDAEISIETDPGAFTVSQLRSYQLLGVNRVSVGVQTFDDDLLKLCGRAHDVADVYRAIEAVYSTNIKSWSLDLMSGLPGLTESTWEASINAALDAAPTHLSVYDLQIEEHTPFAKQYRPGVAPLPSEEVAAAMYGQASKLLRNAGYEHYEVSNYAKPGHRCVHNMTYWEGLPYYAFGMGAASYLQGRRFSRPRKLNAYLKWLQEEMEDKINNPSENVNSGSNSGGGGGISNKKRLNKGEPIVPGLDVPRESVEERLTDTIMLRLRLADGLDLRTICRDFVDGDEIGDVIIDSLVEHEQRGHVVFIREGNEGGKIVEEEKGVTFSGGDRRKQQSGDRKGQNKIIEIKLTDPEGFVQSNDVISDIFVALDEIKRE